MRKLKPDEGYTLIKVEGVKKLLLENYFKGSENNNIMLEGNYFWQPLFSALIATQKLRLLRTKS